MFRSGDRPSLLGILHGRQVSIDNREPLIVKQLKWSIYYDRLVDKFPIISIERRTGRRRLGWVGEVMTKKMGDNIQIGGRRSFLSPIPSDISRGIEDNVANAVLIKPNQIGTLTETLAAIPCHL